jgi:hypothetical protein
MRKPIATESMDVSMDVTAGSRVTVRMTSLPLAAPISPAFITSVLCVFSVAIFS